DATLANPLGPPARGWNQVAEALERAASQLRDGEPATFERISGHATADLAYIVEIERSRMKVAGSDDMARVSLRVTTVFRREDDGWKAVHRHADPITIPRRPSPSRSRSSAKIASIPAAIDGKALRQSPAPPHPPRPS